MNISSGISVLLSQYAAHVPCLAGTGTVSITNLKLLYGDLTNTAGTRGNSKAGQFL